MTTLPRLPGKKENFSDIFSSVATMGAGRAVAIIPRRGSFHGRVLWQGKDRQPPTQSVASRRVLFFLSKAVRCENYIAAHFRSEVTAFESISPH